MKDILKVTHYGKWVIDEENDISIDCYVTSDRRRILSLRGTARAMGLKGGGSGALVRNLNSRWIDSYLSQDLKVWLYDMENGNINKIKGNNGNKFYPFDGELFVDLCNAYVRAQKDRIFDNPGLSGNQSIIADKLLTIMSAFAKVGITALIDEITGYQEDREKDELQKIISKYVTKEFLTWTERFPKVFYEELFRLRNWEYKGKGMTPYVGKITNWIVYYRLPEGVLDELKRLNPIINAQTGYRRYNLHQNLSKEHGVKHLDIHISNLIPMMRGCGDWDEFEKIFRRSYGVPKESTIDNPVVKVIKSYEDNKI